jgi:pantetheine-phosphate adenylyltransferase
MSSVVYALSADPLTNGHLNIIDRALKTFDHVIVAIGINPKKKYTFTLEERENLTRKVLVPYGDRITVKSYSGLLSDFAYENQIFNIVRGARNAADFDFEKLLSDINAGFNLGLETFIMVADSNLSHISSSAVKELQEHQAKNVKEYVPLIIKEALELKISGQYRIGITGGIGTGKSYIEDSLTKIAMDRKLISYCSTEPYQDIPVNSIDMDKIGRYILRESEEPLHKKVRIEVAAKVGHDLMENGKINIPNLLWFLFKDTHNPLLRPIFEEIMAEPTLHQIRKQLIGVKGIVLISSALFVEQGVCELVNNNFIYVTCSDKIRIQRLEKRGYSPLEIRERLAAQLSPETKLNAIKNLIRQQSCGSVIEFDNSNESNTGEKMEELFQTILSTFKEKL